MSYCYKCGADVKDGYKFCSICGAPANVTVTPPTAEKTEPSVSVASPNVTVVDAPPVQTKAEPSPKKPVSPWGYLGLILLLCIPMIGVITFIIMAIAAKRTALKNFARGALLYFLFSVILTLLGILAVVALITPLINFVHSYIMGITSGVTGDVLGTVFEILYYIGSVFGYYPPLS